MLVGETRCEMYRFVLLTGFVCKRLGVADTVCFHLEECVLLGMRLSGTFSSRK